MMEERRQLQEIAGLEQWLAESLPLDEPHSTEGLKLRVRVELNEQWLRAKYEELPAESVPDQVREAVRNATGEFRQRGMAIKGLNHAHRWRWMSGAALGLAAMLFFSIADFRSEPAAVDMTQMDDDVVVFGESADDEDFDDQLDDVLAALDDLLASRDETEWDSALEGL